MKRFMLPRNPLMDAVELPSSPSPTPTTSSTKPRPSSRKHKPSKENDTPSFITPSPAKLKSPLPPRPPSSNPLKRKLTAVDAVTNNSLPAPSDSGIKVMICVPILTPFFLCSSVSVLVDFGFGLIWQVVVNAEMVEYYDISSCYILRPWSMAIWEIMQSCFNFENNVLEFFDPEVKKMKIKTCYFPLFVSPEILQKEKDHVEDFAPEVKVCESVGPSSLLARYGTLSSPLCGAYRSFDFRSRQFLWQEGHTAFATKDEADAEAFIPNTGRGIQGATSYCLGQNFAKMFEINFENEKGEKAMVWKSSWAYSTQTVSFNFLKSF
ncbi:Proline--tRNA ligase, cytoplasmic [Glycine soja]